MDVVGYSKLMRADEAGTLARLKTLRRDLIDPTIAQHSGRTFKLVGDGSLVEFASAVDAVSCALEIQDLIGKNNEDAFVEKKIELRMGVNVGDVLVDGDDIYGDGVNIAARIEALAEPGGVFLSRSAADAVRGKLPVRLENRGHRSVKNIAQPVEVLLVLWDERSASQSSLLGLDALDEQTLPPWPPDWDRDRAPYRGLRPLESIDASIFFGRDGPITEAMERLKNLSLSADKRILVILGASGAGKSSFLRAGLLPRLARSSSRFLPLPAIRPEHSALFGENGLLGVLETALPGRTRAEIRAAIRGGADQLAPMLTEIGAKWPHPQGAFDNSAARLTVILAIDQAEELFRAEGSEQAEALLTLVRDLAHGREQQVVTIFAIRSDSYDALQRARSLEGLAQSALPLLPLPRGAYKDVIEGPARRFAYGGGKLTIEPQLTERLLEDLEKGGGDALPLLAFTLEQLFLEYRRSGVLRLADYEEFGELRGAIDAAVGRAFRRADADPNIPKDRRARETLLRRGLIPWLAGIDPDTKSPRRNIARRSDIPEEARPLIDLLVEERLLSTDTYLIAEDEPGTITRVATIEPAHEALLRRWGLLEGWIAEDLGLLATLEGIRRAARDWEANGMAEAWLAHQGLRLVEARALDARPDLAAQLDGRDRAYLERCSAREAAAIAEREQARANELARAKAEAERAQAEADRATAQARYSRQLTRIIAAAAGVFALVAIAAAALGFIAKREATRAEESYRIARDAADSLVVDIAEGLRAVEGMPTASVRRILDTARGVVERLVAAAPDDLDLGSSRVLMQRQFAVNYAAIGDLARALEFGQASVAGARQILATRPNKDSMITLASSLLQVGQIDLQRGDADGARAAANESLDLASNMASAGKDEVAADQITARALLLLSDIEIARGDIERGLKSAKAAVATTRPRADAAPSDAALQTLLADALERSGNILGGIDTEFTVPRRLDPALPTESRGIDLKAALEAFQSSATIFRHLSAATPTDTDLRGRLENILRRIGRLDLALGALPEALATHKEALAISSELLAADPGNTDWKRRVEVEHELLNYVQMARRDYDDALAESRDGLDIAQRLFDLDPSNLRWRRDLGGRLTNVGLALRAKGDSTTAQASLDKALDLRRETVKLYPDDVSAQVEFVLALYRVGNWGPPQKATPLLREALQVLDEMKRAGTLPKPNESWAPFIRERLAQIEASDAPK